MFIDLSGIKTGEEDLGRLEGIEVIKGLVLQHLGQIDRGVVIDDAFEFDPLPGTVCRIAGCQRLHDRGMRAAGVAGGDQEILVKGEFILVLEQIAQAVVRVNDLVRESRAVLNGAVFNDGDAETKLHVSRYEQRNVVAVLQMPAGAFCINDQREALKAVAVILLRADEIKVQALSRKNALVLDSADDLRFVERLLPVKTVFADLVVLVFFQPADRVGTGRGELALP